MVEKFNRPPVPFEESKRLNESSNQKPQSPKGIEDIFGVREARSVMEDIQTLERDFASLGSETHQEIMMTIEGNWMFAAATWRAAIDDERQQLNVARQKLGLPPGTSEQIRGREESLRSVEQRIRDLRSRVWGNARERRYRSERGINVKYE